MTITSKTLLTTTLAAAMSLFGNAFAQTPAPAPAKTKSTAPKAAPAAAPTDQEIADAKAKGLVWVNLNTKVYHMSDAAVYGKTKHGKFMTEDDAKKAGYRQAKEPAPKKTAATKKTDTTTKK